MTPIRAIFFLCLISFLKPIESFWLKNEINSIDTVKSYCVQSIQDVIHLSDSIHSEIKAGNLKKARECYKQARILYKKIQWFVEYISPNDIKLFVNGPPLPKHDRENGNKVYQPHGFQLLEEQLFDSLTLPQKDLLFEINILRETLNQIQTKSKHIRLNEIQYWDALQFELIRLVSLHLNGYDSPILKQNALETTYALNGIKAFLDTMASHQKFQSGELNEILLNTRNYLSQNSNVDSLDRLFCLKKYFQPLYKNLVKFRKEHNIGFMPVAYAVNMENEILFGKNFFNLNYFNRRSNDSKLITDQIVLGKFLFYDPILSGNNQRSCASCHQPEYGFSDNRVSALAFNQKNKLKRNTPGLINVAYQTLFFSDGRAFQLEEQASDVIHAQNEMNTVPEEVISKLRQSNEYLALFKKAFQGSRDTAITFYAVLKAIAEYERSLTDWDTPFDNILSLENSPIPEEIRNGYNVFNGKALCGTCHFVPLFHGLVPPFYAEQEFEVLGVPEKPNGFAVDKDSGRYIITRKNIHLYAFKTPGLRNLTYTKPYMHHGKYKSLEDVIEFYLRGGSAALKKPLENQTLPFDSLALSKKDIKNLVAFLNSLNSPDLKKKFQSPENLPKINNNSFNKRRIGGVY